MKVEDLMIGDWVDVYHELTDESGFYKPLRVTGIHYNDGICFGDSTIESPWNDLKEFEEGVRPIPLTPEILEKNGFEKVDNMYPFPTFRCDDKENYLCITIGFPEGNKTKRKYPFIEIDGKDIFVEYLIINFVHELQHALKLCGIEKEIVV